MDKNTGIRRDSGRGFSDLKKLTKFFNRTFQNNCRSSTNLNYDKQNQEGFLTQTTVLLRETDVYSDVDDVEALPKGNSTSTVFTTNNTVTTGESSHTENLITSQTQLHNLTSGAPRSLP